MVGEELPLPAPVVAAGRVGVATEHRCQVEAEPVDAHRAVPVLQRVQHQLPGRPRAEVQLIAGAGGAVDEVVVGGEHVVVGGREPAQRRETRGQQVVVPVPALAGVVVDDVQDDLDAARVHGAHHLFELARRAARGLVVGVVAVGGEEPDRLVAPVVDGALGRPLVVGVGLVHRHELDRRDAEGAQIGGHQRGARVGAAQFLGNVDDALEAGRPPEQGGQRRRGRVQRQVLDVGLVDRGVVVRRGGRAASGGGLVEDEDPLGGDAAGVDLARGASGVRHRAGRERHRGRPRPPHQARQRRVGDLAGVRVEQHLVGVEAVAVGVQVGFEAGARPAAAPGRVVAPVGPPASEGVEGPVFEAGDRRAPDAVASGDHLELALGVRAEGRGVELEHHARRGRRVHGERRVAREGVVAGPERPGGIGPTADLGRLRDLESLALHEG